MVVLVGKRVSQRLCLSAWRTFCESKVKKDPYWKAKFPDRIASFDEIPTITEGLNPRHLQKETEQWFKKFGHVVKMPMPFGKYTVYLYHFEDFLTVYRNDGRYPIRQSHQALAQYRQERRNIYSNVGLGAAQGEEWSYLRGAASKVLFHPKQKMAEDIVDDLLKLIRKNLNSKGEIDLLPLLHRWAFENIGAITLNRRLNALSEMGNELADKMVHAAAVTDEMIALTTMEPTTLYEERYNRLAEAQDYFYSVLKKYINDIKRDIELEPESDGAAQCLLMKNSYSESDVIALILDMYAGALQTVPLTANIALYHLARNSEIQAKARQEVKQRMPSKDSRYFDVKGPKEYIASVLHETLRLNPPILGNGRVIQKDLILGGYSVPAYTNVILNVQVAFRLEENFADPLKFIPRRKEGHVKILHIFGTNVRMCPGRISAISQLLLVLSKIIRNFEVSYDGGEVTIINQLHNMPEKPLIFRLKPIDE